jgi:hypothetical protein
MDLFNLTELEITLINESRLLTQSQLDVIVYLIHKMAGGSHPRAVESPNVLRITRPFTLSRKS